MKQAVVAGITLQTRIQVLIIGFVLCFTYAVKHIRVRTKKNAQNGHSK